ncbi:MAG TPA: hypothetical protein VIJ22_13860 [Polyangiaceae bacterium]
MARKEIEDITEELRSWIGNYDQGPDQYPSLLFRILASLPGGDRLEDVGFAPFVLGWHEIEQLTRVLDAIESKRDVEDLVDGLLADDEDG